MILPRPTPTLLTSYETWDAQHYLYLAAHGYSPGIQSNAFYPLFPLIVRFLAFSGLPYWTVGLILSNGLSLGASAFFYLFVKNIWDEKIAFQSCLWSLAFPTAFYSGLLYTESLFLFLTLTFFYYFQQGRLFPSTCCAFLLPLSRPTGVMVSLALLVGGKAGPVGNKQTIVGRVLPVVTVFVGFIIYLLLMKILTGDYFSGFSALGSFVNQSHIEHFLRPWNWFMENFIHNPYTLNMPQTSFLNRAMFLIVVLTLPLLYPNVGKKLFAYTLVLGIVPALSTNLMSYIRYASVLFPFFILAALKIKEGRVQNLILSICFLVQAFLLIAHSLNYWVG
jgi:hypothetical protein